MTLNFRSSFFVLVLVAMFAAAGSVEAQDKKITFTGQTPVGEVSLDPAEPVRIGTDGNIIARCRTGTDGKCVQTGFSGGGGAAPTVVLQGDQFSNPPDTQQLYNPGTTLRITATVTLGEVCVRVLQPTTLGGTNWAGIITSPFPAATVTLPAASTTYGFGMRCFGAGGATNATVLTYATNAATPPPTGDQCNAATLAAVEASRAGFTDAVMTATNNGLNAVPVARPEAGVQTSRFSDLVSHSTGQACGEFPFIGSAQCKIHAGRAQFVSIRFVVPSDGSFPPAREFDMLSSQESGVPSSGNLYNVSISQCPGDFRLPTSATAPAGDPTLSYGCRNTREVTPGNLLRFGKVVYNLTGVSDASTCGLTAGNTYYFNYVSANPLAAGGVTTANYTCPDATEPSQGGPGYCGIQLRAN